MRGSTINERTTKPTLAKAVSNRAARALAAAWLRQTDVGYHHLRISVAFGRFIARSVIISVFGAVLCGCSVFSPRVGEDVPEPGVRVFDRGAEYKLNVPSNDEYFDETVTLQEAIAYVNEKIERYQIARREHDEASAALGVALIPLGAAAVGLGIWEANPRLITGLALGGAAAYATGNLYIQPVRAEIYHRGIKALTCARVSVEPLNRPQAWRVTLRTGAATLNEALAPLRSKTTDVEALLADIDAGNSVANTALIARARALQATAVALHTSAALNHGAAVGVLGAIDQAGPKVVNAADTISEEVSHALDATVVTLDAAFAAAGQLRGLATQFYGADLPRPKRAEDVAPTDAERDALEKAKVDRVPSIDDQLRAASTALAAQIDKVTEAARPVAAQIADFNTGSSAQEAAEKLKACEFDAADIAAPLSLDPPGPVSLKAGESQLVTINGGLSPYVPKTVEQGVTGLSIDQNPIGGKSFIVRTTSETPDGSYTIGVAHGPKLETAASLQISVTAGGAGGDSNVGVTNTDDNREEPGGAGELSEAGNSEPLTSAELALLQRQAGVPLAESGNAFGPLTMNAIRRTQMLVGLAGRDVDGKVGPITRGAIDRYIENAQISVGNTSSPLLDEAVVNRLLLDAGVI